MREDPFGHWNLPGPHCHFHGSVFELDGRHELEDINLAMLNGRPGKRGRHVPLVGLCEFDHLGAPKRNGPREKGIKEWKERLGRRLLAVIDGWLEIEQRSKEADFALAEEGVAQAANPEIPTVG